MIIIYIITQHLITDPKNDIIIMIEQGGNDGTLTANNAANKIAGHRTGSYEDHPTPGIYENNGMDMKMT